MVSKSNPSNDYVEKAAGHPALGIGLYLVVYPRDGTITVHDDPRRGAYRNSEPHIFGDVAPFGEGSIDTSAFRRYGTIGDA